MMESISSWIGGALAGGVLSLAWGALKSVGVFGIIALVAAFVLFGGLKKFASTPKGMLIIAGVLVAALAVCWLMPRMAEGGGGRTGGLARARQLAARKKAVQKAMWKQVNAQADQMNAQALARMMAAAMASGIPIAALPMPAIGLPTIPPIHGPAPVRLGGGASAPAIVSSVSTAPPAPARAVPVATLAATPATLTHRPANATSAAPSSSGPASSGPNATSATSTNPTAKADLSSEARGAKGDNASTQTASVAKAGKGSITAGTAMPKTATKPTSGKVAAPALASTKARGPNAATKTVNATLRHRAERRARTEVALQAMTGMNRSGQLVAHGGGMAGLPHHGQGAGSAGHASRAEQQRQARQAWNHAAMQEMYHMDHQQQTMMQHHMMMGGGHPGMVPMHPRQAAPHHTQPHMGGMYRHP
jgi:hypothetical protein